MANFQYEWYTVKMKCFTGIYTAEVKAKNKENAIKQFKEFDDVIEIYWETLAVDRKGYQRRW